MYRKRACYSNYITSDRVIEAYVVLHTHHVDMYWNCYKTAKITFYSISLYNNTQ